jgi:transcriptional regulator with XRE-family HTH domain
MASRHISGAETIKGVFFLRAPSADVTKKPFQNCLGVEFRKLRKRSGRTQASVATTAGISLPAIRKLERGLGNLATWTKALDALGWTLRGRNLPAGDSIGRQVAILRKRQKLSKRSPAAMAGITQPTVIALEVRNSGRLSSLNAILTVLGAGPVLSAAGENPSFYGKRHPEHHYRGVR